MASPRPVARPVKVQIDGDGVRPPLTYTMDATSVAHAAQQLQSFRPNLAVVAAIVKVQGGAQQGFVSVPAGEWDNQLPQRTQVIGFHVEVQGAKRARTASNAEKPCKLRRSDSKAPQEDEEEEKNEEAVPAAAEEEKEEQKEEAVPAEANAAAKENAEDAQVDDDPADEAEENNVMDTQQPSEESEKHAAAVELSTLGQAVYYATEQNVDATTGKVVYTTVARQVHLTEQAVMESATRIFTAAVADSSAADEGRILSETQDIVAPTEDDENVDTTNVAEAQPASPKKTANELEKLSNGDQVYKAQPALLQSVHDGGVADNQVDIDDEMPPLVERKKPAPEQATTDQDKKNGIEPSDEPLVATQEATPVAEPEVPAETPVETSPAPAPPATVSLPPVPPTPTRPPLSASRNAFSSSFRNVNPIPSFMRAFAKQ